MAYIGLNEFQSISNHTCYSAVHVNARSLRKHYNEFHTLFSSTTSPISVICVSETWLSESDKNLYGFPSYTAEYCHRRNSSHGGSAIFVLGSVTYKRRLDLSLNVPDCESVWIEVDSPNFLTITRKPFLAAFTVRRALLSQTSVPLLMISCILCQTKTKTS